MHIYQPAEDSYLLQKHVLKHASGRVLDLGTGSGIQALAAAENKNVREVVAVDVNKKAVLELSKLVKIKKLKKIRVKVSDLFSNVENKFDTIIFNPPYLPEDKIAGEKIEDPALYGGKKGWELSEKFFHEINEHLSSQGKILFLFSSLTNKEKVEQIIEYNLLEFEELERKKLPFFEELYVYLIKKSAVLRELERKNIDHIHYFSHGRRGNIFTGTLDKSKLVKTHFAKNEQIKVAVKIKRKESKAKERIQNEAKWLKILNKHDLGPKYLFAGNDFLVYEFVVGKFIQDWIKENNCSEIKKVLANVLGQCYLLDRLKVDKEEMHHPFKHIVVKKGNLPVLLDFERSHSTQKPKNLTQFIEFVCRIKKVLESKNLKVDADKLRQFAGRYKRTYDYSIVEKIIKMFN